MKYCSICDSEYPVDFFTVRGREIALCNNCAAAYLFLPKGSAREKFLGFEPEPEQVQEATHEAKA